MKTVLKTYSKYYATTGIASEVMLKTAFDFYGSLLYGPNRCVEIWPCFLIAFYNRNDKNVSHNLSQEWYMPARVPINWRGGAQACLLEYAAPGIYACR